MTIIHREAYFAMRRVESDCERIRRIADRAVLQIQQHTEAKRAQIEIYLRHIESRKDNEDWRMPSDTEVPFSA